MKKLTILTSILALAACGGGSGGGSGAARTSVYPIDLGGQYSKIACKSDRSECRGVTVDSDGNSVVSDARVASGRLSRYATTHGNIAVGNEQWDLFYADDIDMNIIYSPGKLAKQTFIVDSQGNITGLKWSGGSEVAKFVPRVVLSGMQYTGDNKFSLKSFESDGTLEFENYDDLRFANFGVVKLRDMEWTGHDVGAGNMDIPFAGGYDVLKQNPIANQTTTYTGTARGMVEYAGTSAYSGNDTRNVQDYLNITAEGATLTVDTTGENVVETFAGNFVKTEDTSKQWYTITATNNNGSINYGFTGSNGTGDTKFDMDGANATIKRFDTGYYSDKKDEAAEASGLFQYQERINAENVAIEENNKTVYIGFGGKTE
jgi:hypothetical protein